MVLNFAENYLAHFQNEIQSGRWAYENVTIFPAVTFHTCTYGVTQTHYDVVISKDLQHDANAIREYVNIVLEHHKEEGTEFNKIYQYTDGCSTQFKSQKPFYDISTDTNVVWSYFGSGH